MERITRETVFGEKSRLNARWGAFGVDFQRQKSSDFNFRRLNHLPEWMCLLLRRPTLTIKSSSPPKPHVAHYIKYIVSNHYQINRRTVNHLLVICITKDFNLSVFLNLILLHEPAELLFISARLNLQWFFYCSLGVTETSSWVNHSHLFTPFILDVISCVVTVISRPYMAL